MPTADDRGRRDEPVQQVEDRGDREVPPRRPHPPPEPLGEPEQCERDHHADEHAGVDAGRRCVLLVRNAVVHGQRDSRGRDGQERRQPEEFAPPAAREDHVVPGRGDGRGRIVCRRRRRRPRAALTTTASRSPRGPVPSSGFPLLPLATVARRVRPLQGGGELQDVLLRRQLAVGEHFNLQVLHPLVGHPFEVDERLARQLVDVRPRG